MENQLVSCRAETFPAGLRVLVVDDDPTWLKILEKMLRKCSYEVTTCGLARVALDILRERKDKFDIVISDVNMPDMDGFKLLEHVGLEMDLPVIMMSIDGETSRVMKGVQHGACDYLLKPVRMKELRNIWQHVYRKRMHEVKEIEGHNIHEDIYFLRNGSEDLEERHFFNGNDTGSLRKRKDVDTKEHADQDFNDPATVKKARVVWSVDLHQKFVNAVNQIGFDKVGPKKILDLMNVPGLTRENVASHLQKYRLYLSRLQKQNEGRSCSRNILSDCNNKDRDGSFGIQSSKEMEQDSVHTNYLSTKFQAQEVNTGIHVDDLRGLRNLPLTDNMKPLKGSASGIQKTDNLSQLDAIFSSNNMAPNVGNKLCDPTSSEKKIWNEGLPVTQFMKYPKRIHERCNLLEDFSCLPKPDQEQQFVSSHLQSTSSIISITCNSENDTTGLCELKPVVTDYTSGCFAYIPPVTWAVDPVSIEIKHDLVNSQDIRANSELGGSPSIKDECFEQSYNNGHLPSAYDSSVKSGIDFDLLPEDLHLFALQGISCFKNADIDGRDVFEDNSTPATEFIQGNWYEGSEFNCENSYDLLDYPTDEFLFAQ